jgi:hydroxyacid-oxoacid transhydrogenase
VDHPMIPHGMSVILNAPAVFRFTAPACAQRHLNAATILGAETSRAKLEDAGEILAEQIISYMQKLDVPNGLRAVGYTGDDIPALVKGTIPQHRVTKLSPRPAAEDDLSQLFQNAMSYW